jgi:hypothetical protein
VNDAPNADEPITQKSRNRSSALNNAFFYSVSSTSQSQGNHMSRTKLAALFFASVSTLASSHTYAAQRAFVASYGTDVNTAANCSLASPCRGFAAAATVTDANGEIIVLDSAGYGPVTITKSISIIAPAGVYAGITVFSGAPG